MKKVLDIFLEIVQISSPSGHESDMASYIQNYLNSLGIACNVDSLGNVFASLKGREEPVLLCVHLDTVEPGCGIKPIVSRGFVKSSGETILGSDNKAAVAAILAALPKIKESGRSAELLFTVGEETISGIKSFDFKNVKSKCALVADSGEAIGTIVSASPWILELDIDVHGKSSHSSVPEMGNNALFAASSALATIPLGKVGISTTVNFGVIKGGDAVNTIPGWISLNGEIRSFDKRELDETLGLIEEKFRAVSSQLNVESLFRKNIYCEGFEIDKSDSFVKRVRKAIKLVANEVSYISSYGATDANYLQQIGINAVNIGDGCVDVHTVNEKILVKDLDRLSNIFLEVVNSSYFTQPSRFDKLSKTL